jgi:phosphohistidine phosphatase SixA
MMWNNSTSYRIAMKPNRRTFPKAWKASEMDLVLIRHGARNPEETDLTLHGKHQIVMLADALNLRETVPDLILTSHRGSAWVTAGIVREILSPELVPPMGIDALTPPGGQAGIAGLVRGTAEAGLDLEDYSCVFLIGHERRLSDLVIELTGQRSRPIPRGGAVCVRGDNFVELVSGRGAIYYRYPTVDYQEDQLRSKVNSKMTVASLLAGFVLTALTGLLLLDNRPWAWETIIAIITLSASLILFVASVYIYDQLSMPSGFWNDGGRLTEPWETIAQARATRQEKCWEELYAAADVDGIAKAESTDNIWSDIYREVHAGPVYWLMVRTSRTVFTPAVFLALASLVVLLIGTGDAWIWASGVIALFGAMVYAAIRRPSLGADLSNSRRRPALWRLAPQLSQPCWSGLR